MDSSGRLDYKRVMKSNQLAGKAIERAHRWFAVECNNRAWNLTAKSKRSARDNREMLLTAYAAAFHWSKIGKPINDARAELLLAHVHALLGQGDEALRHARRCLQFFRNNDGEDWDIAFAHAEMAHAAATLGDRPLHAKHYAAAQKTGQAIKDNEDRKVFFQEFARIPGQVRRQS
jgi:tetratricopeptide (TPR) repeat protein